jgi:hypothetical protein
MAGVSRVRPRSIKEIDKIAYQVLEEAQPDALKFTISFDIENFFEFDLEDKTGIEAIYKWFPEGLDGYTDSVNMRCYASTRLYEYGECQVTKRRLRSTLAHELGHCYLHVEEANENRSYQKKFLNNKFSSLNKYKPSDIEVYEDPEWQAWRFASAILMPEHCFRTAVERNFSKKMLRRAFGVNQPFIDVRIRELKITKSIRNG